MITDFWGNPITEKKIVGLKAFRNREACRKYNNSPKGKAANKNYYAKHSERIKKARLKYLYKITDAERDEKFEAQERKCAICKTSNFGKKGPHTDHCHETKVFRGILCQRCNHALGLFDDDISNLAAAIEYVIRGVIKHVLEKLNEQGRN